MESENEIDKRSSKIVRSVSWNVSLEKRNEKFCSMKSLSKRIPASVEFYIDYIKIELQVRPIEHNRIKNAFEQSLIYFGRTSAGRKRFVLFFSFSNCFSRFSDLWLFYLDYLRENQSTDFVAASRVHGRAVHALESDELKRFNEECAMKNLVWPLLKNKRENGKKTKISIRTLKKKQRNRFFRISFRFESRWPTNIIAAVRILTATKARTNLIKKKRWKLHSMKNISDRPMTTTKFMTNRKLFRNFSILPGQNKIIYRARRSTRPPMIMPVNFYTPFAYSSRSKNVFNR